MAYFNHAFIKCFNPVGLGTGKTSDLGAGELALVNSTTWSTPAPANKPAYIAMGSYHTQDNIGNNPGHGGYSESVKSKMINPKYVTRIYSTVCQTAKQSQTCISVAKDCVPCGEALFVRLDVKGSPALRFLNHNAYATTDSGNVCCTATGQTHIDPSAALVENIKQLLADPIVSPFFELKQIEILDSTGAITATYADIAAYEAGHTVSTDPIGDDVNVKVCLGGAYVDTKFGDCSFDTRDFYGKEPVQLIGSVLDETGDPCSDCGVVTNSPGIMQQTIGETVLRDILMTENYMQSPYNQGNPDSARIREIEGSDAIVASVDRNALYRVFVIQHSVPRFNNPTGVFDNDQYLYKIYAPCGSQAEDDMNDFIDSFQDWVTSSGNQVEYENGIDELV
jgi:hypothetical protein